ncbi:hypothetical protein ACRAWF_18960 [Streptomyces sp. L7]
MRRLNLLSGNIVTGEHTDDFTTAQSNLLAEYRRVRPTARIAVGRVVVPFDSADRATRARYRTYAGTRRARRTLAPQGQGADPVRARCGRHGGTDRLSNWRRTRWCRRSPSCALRLPYEFRREEYEQILHDVLHLVAPRTWLAPRAVGGGAMSPVQLEVHAREPFADGHTLPPRAERMPSGHRHGPLHRGPRGARPALDHRPGPGTARQRRGGALQRGRRDPAAGRRRTPTAVLRLGQPGQQAGRPVLLRRLAHEPPADSRRRGQRLPPATRVHGRLRRLAG